MMDSGLAKGLIAIVTMATFLGICWWAYRPGNRERFEQDAMLAFDDDEQPIAPDGSPGSSADGESSKTEIDA